MSTASKAIASVAKPAPAAFGVLLLPELLGSGPFKNVSKNEIVMPLTLAYVFSGHIEFRLPLASCALAAVEEGPAQLYVVRSPGASDALWDLGKPGQQQKWLRSVTDWANLTLASKDSVRLVFPSERLLGMLAAGACCGALGIVYGRRRGRQYRVTTSIAGTLTCGGAFLLAWLAAAWGASL